MKPTPIGRPSYALVFTAALVLAGCEDRAPSEDDPPLRIPGVSEVTAAPPGMPGVGMPAPSEFEPALAIPGEPSPLPIRAPAMPPGMDPSQMPPGMDPSQMPPGMDPSQANGRPIPPAALVAPGVPLSLSTGFMPDPRVGRGVAGGPVDAATFHESCVGSISPEPNHILQAATPFRNLRILVHSTGDTTLVVRAPDGSFRCDDDSEALDPIVEGEFAPGAYSIWVGSYGGNAVPYVIGFSELSHVTTASLGG